jgi:hypothetical protein
METNNCISVTRQSEVTLNKADFFSNGIKIAAIIYMPSSALTATYKTSPAIVVSHPGTGVKEQTAGLYAQLLAEQGFIALTFDAAYQGESEGLPRGLEDPAQRVEDIKCAVSFLGTLPQVDTDRIGVLGICASGGYGIMAAAADQRIKAIATVSAADIARQFKKGGNGNQDPQVFQHLLSLAAADRFEEAKGNQPRVLPVFPTEEQAKAMGAHVYEGWQYYCTNRGQHPRSAKVLTLSSIDRIATFDAFAFVNLIAPRPLLMIVGSKAETMWMTKEAYAAALQPKELMIIEGASHVALYDKMEFIEPALSKLVDFFTVNLK